MKRQVEISLMKRIFQGIESRQTADMAEDLCQFPIEIYTSHELFLKEKNTLFREFPLAVGFSSQVPNPGEYLTNDLTETPIIVIRNEDGVLSAYINACRHRGARMLNEPSGNCKRNLVCPYHGWCYAAKDGALRSLPHPIGFPGLDKSEYGLIALPVEERFGIIFVLPSPNKTLQLDAYLGELFQDMESFGYHNHVLYKSGSQQRKMNWKFHVEVNSEIYHFAFLHQKSSAENYLNFGAVFDYQKPHSRMIAPQKSILKMMTRDESEWKLEGNVGLVYFLFPNMLYFTAFGYGHVLSVFPQDESHCTFMSGMLVPNLPRTPENEKLWEFHYQNYWAAMNEDMVMGENVHATLRSGANTHHTFGRYEQMCARFEKVVQEVIERKYGLADMLQDSVAKTVETL